MFIPGVYQGSIPHLRAEDVDEERRLLYVAMTRAQGLLYLSFPAKSSNGGISSVYHSDKDKTKLSVFLEQPNIKTFLATRASAIDAQGLAAIVNRCVPSEDQISKACLRLYALNDIIVLRCRPSIYDDDCIEGPNTDKPNLEGAIAAASRIREWSPQTTVTHLPVTQIGFTTTMIARTTKVVGLDKLNPANGMTTGFMSSRDALSVLSTEHTTININKKRKAKHPPPIKSKPQATKQSTLTSWISQDESTRSKETCEIKPRSSGIVHDRGKPVPVATLPVDQSSSPARGYDLDALSSVSFSSPTSNVKGYDEEFESPLAKPGKRFTVEQPPVMLLNLGCQTMGPTTAPTGTSVSGIGMQRKSLGIRRGMKPWPSGKG